MRRATEEHVVKGKGGDTLEGSPLAQFLLNVQEYEQVSAKLTRRLRDVRLVDLLAASGIGKRSDFEDDKKLKALAKAIEKEKLKLEAEVSFDEEHSLHELVVRNGVQRKINWALAASPDFKRLLALHELLIPLDKPPFLVTHNGDKETKESAQAVLAYVLEDAKKEFTITRF